jgi:hypothetical protein
VSVCLYLALIAFACVHKDALECLCGSLRCRGVIGVQRKQARTCALPAASHSMVQLTMDSFLVGR